MNKVFLSGTLKKQPETLYTPRGEKLIIFPLWVDEGAFNIDVIFQERPGTKEIADMTGSTIMVSGALEKGAGKKHDQFRLMANKIIRMEV